MDDQLSVHRLESALLAGKKAGKFVVGGFKSAKGSGSRALNRAETIMYLTIGIFAAIALKNATGVLS